MPLSKATQVTSSTARPERELNSLAFGDVISLGRAKLKKLNLVDTRLAENERKKREEMLAIEHLESITGIASDDEGDLTERGFAKYNF